MSTITLGVDLAKSVFSVCEMDAADRVLGRRDLGREAFARWLDQHATLPGEFKELLRDLSAHWAQLRTAIDACSARIDAHVRQDARCVRIGAIVGVGPITVDAMVASVGNVREFRNGRQLATWLGVVPTQHSSGGHTRLGTISCRGDAYLPRC